VGRPNLKIREYEKRYAEAVYYGLAIHREWMHRKCLRKRDHTSDHMDKGVRLAHEILRFIRLWRTRAKTWYYLPIIDGPGSRLKDKTETHIGIG
jgi:hypothetical protein